METKKLLQKPVLKLVLIWEVDLKKFELGVWFSKPIGFTSFQIWPCYKMPRYHNSIQILVICLSDCVKRDGNEETIVENRVQNDHIEMDL